MHDYVNNIPIKQLYGVLSVLFSSEYHGAKASRSTILPQRNISPNNRTCLTKQIF